VIYLTVKYEEDVNLFKAVADTNRLIIVDMLSCGELCACEILEKFKITQPTLSHHMKILCDCGLVTGRKEGKWTYYSLNEAAVGHFRDVLRYVTSMKTSAGVSFPGELHYETYKKDKSVFRLPSDIGFYFNENDVWAFVDGSCARIGVTDFVQKSMSDILFYTPPKLGDQIAQFEEAGAIESGKKVFDIISPVSGKITAYNKKLVDSPEMINANPYEQGWIAEIELADFETDKDLLHTFEGYFPILKRKADEYRVKK